MIVHGRLNPGGKFVRERVVSKCTRPQISVLASHGEVPDKPVILTGQISAEKPLHSMELRLVDRIESSSDKQKCSASSDSPRPRSDLSHLLTPGWATTHQQALLLLGYGPACSRNGTYSAKFYIQTARLVCSLLLMQEECCSPFPFLIVSHS